MTLKQFGLPAVILLIGLAGIRGSMPASTTSAAPEPENHPFTAVKLLEQKTNDEITAAVAAVRMITEQELTKGVLSDSIQKGAVGLTDIDVTESAPETSDTEYPADDTDNEATAETEAEDEQEEFAEDAESEEYAAEDTSAGDGIWYAYYRGTDDPGYANSDGSLSEWTWHYYIAHDWSDAGQTIISEPSVVCVDGIYYYYAGDMLVSRDTDWEDVADWATGDGGVTFQTCYGGEYLLVHYVP